MDGNGAREGGVKRRGAERDGKGEGGREGGREGGIFFFRFSVAVRYWRTRCVASRLDG